MTVVLRVFQAKRTTVVLWYSFGIFQSFDKRDNRSIRLVFRMYIVYIQFIYNQEANYIYLKSCLYILFWGRLYYPFYQRCICGGRIKMKYTNYTYTNMHTITN